MKKYAILSPKLNGQLIIGYDDEKWVFLDISQAELTKEQYEWLIQNIPVYKRSLEHWSQVIKNIRIEEIPEDLSFTRFWDLYAYKVGNKNRAEKLWNYLNDADKVKALNSIKRYAQWLRNKPNMERTYAETFLSQRRFENEFKL